MELNIYVGRKTFSKVRIKKTAASSNILIVLNIEHQCQEDEKLKN